MLEAYYEIQKFNQDYSRISKTDKIPSRSFVENFLEIMTIHMGGSFDSILDIRGTANGNWSLQALYGGGVAVGGDGGDLQGQYDNFFQFPSTNYRAHETGLILGTGTTAVTTSDRSLATPIEHGRTSGTMEYLSCGARNFLVNSGTNTASFDIERLFRNVSGGAITVNEIALCVRTWLFNGASYFGSHLILRDVVSPGQSVADGEYLKVIYTIQIVA